MGEPTKITWNVGKDAYGREVTLTYETLYNGKRGFTIRREAMDQRDETESVALLTADNIREIAAALEGFRHG